MNSKYNVLVNYLGDGEFKFSVKKIGEVSIAKNKPVYIYNADIDTINSLRALRRMLIEITIGSKPDGAFKVFNLEDYNREATMLDPRRVNIDKRGVDTMSNNDINSILKSGSNGPIEVEDAKVSTNQEEDEEEKVTKPKTSTKKTTKKRTSKKTSKK